MLTGTAQGLVCVSGGFHIDPVAPVPLAVVTHAHRDHLADDLTHVVCAPPAETLLRRRLGPAVRIDALPYGERRRFGDVDVSLHPAGHVLGSAQVRLEKAERVTVVSGDYKRAPDPTCEPFELVPCDTFVTEATFALPIYRWPSAESVIQDMLSWIATNQRAGRPSVVLAYALGKAQRLILSLHPHLDQPILVHGAVEAMCTLYREAGIAMPEVEHVGDNVRGAATAGRLVIAPPTVLGSPWLKRFPNASVAMASGWMRVRGRRRWKGVDRGFVLSDHADWPALLDTIAATGARRVLTMHGYADVLARHLQEQGLDAHALAAGG